MKDFVIGVNYWDSKSGTDMWKKWDEETVAKDLQALSQYGVKHLRVFPNWRDFQPVKKLYGWGNNFEEYVIGEDEVPYSDVDKNGIDPVMIKRFRRFSEIADNYGMTLTVSILTGWMSGRMFTPPALENKNLFSDPEVRMWTDRFVRGIVSSLKDLKNIDMWDLGNECNNLSTVSCRADAYAWTASIANAIRSVDNTRPISSGMHNTQADPRKEWTIMDQGEICDYLTPHPYPSPTIKGDIEPYNTLRTSILPTVMCEYYTGIGGKPSIIQEQGTFSDSIGNREMAADFIRINILSAWANNAKGYLWWCGMEHSRLKNAPYSWSMIERELGLLDIERQPKPVALEMKKMSELIDRLPKIEDKEVDAICILPRDDNKLFRAEASYILAKQAGFNIKIQNSDTIPDIADAYIIPSTVGWRVTHRRTYDFVLDRVKNHGADLLVTNRDAQFTKFEECFGIRSSGMQRTGASHTAKFNFGEIKYNSDCEFILESIGAKVLAKNEDGNIVLSCNKYGKGNAYFLNFPLELQAVNRAYGFNPDVTEPYYKIYGIFGEKLAKRYILTVDSPYIGVTQSKCKDGSYLITAVNYSNKDLPFKYTVKNGWKIEFLYGNKDSISHCDAAILMACPI